MVIKHQHDAGEHQYDEEVKSDTAEPPGVAVARGVAIYLCRMDVEEKIIEGRKGAIPRFFVVFDAEDRTIELSLLRLLQLFELFLRFGFDDLTKLARFFF
ncbi:MAG: hypothetical protein WBD26_00990 [Candidatus Acidiferrales bacterium]